MKKFLAILLVSVIVFGVVGQALAKPSTTYYGGELPEIIVTPHGNYYANVGGGGGRGCGCGSGIGGRIADWIWDLGINVLLHVLF